MSVEVQVTEQADAQPGTFAGAPVRLLIHGVTCSCRPGCKPGGVCRWVGCCRSPIESARVLPQQGADTSTESDASPTKGYARA